jgi:CubicO group peptidase (beta-lactamase class C family)
MIEPWLFFIPAAICVLVAFCGLACFALASFGLRTAGRASLSRPVDAAEPPKLSDLAEHRTATVDSPAAGTPNQTGRFRRCILAWKFVRAACLLVLLLGIFGLWATGLSLGYRQNPSGEWTDGRAPELEKLIHKRCVKFIDQGKSVGMAVALVSPTNATVMGFGRQSLVSGSPARGDTLFELGSITKTFTALALAREIERGQLQLDQPVRELLPPGTDLPEPARGVTLRHLTTHTSGFPRLAGNMPPLGGLRMLLFGGDPYAGYNEDDLLAGVRNVKLESTPGTKSSYSNFGMTLLGYLLARETGTNFETFIKQAVCQPLAMGDTTITLRRDQPARFAQGYRALLKLGPFVIGLGSAPWFEDNDLGGAGALRSSANDMLKYLQANMRPSGPLEKVFRLSHLELFKESEHIVFGMNWIRSPNDALKQTVIWHNGGTGGFRSFLGFTEDGRFGVVVLSNSGESVDDLGMGLLRDLQRRSQ